VPAESAFAWAFGLSALAAVLACGVALSIGRAPPRPLRAAEAFD